MIVASIFSFLFCLKGVDVMRGQRASAHRYNPKLFHLSKREIKNEATNENPKTLVLESTKKK